MSGREYQRIMSTGLFLWVCTFAVWGIADDDEPIRFPVEMKERSLRLEDENGNPVSNATLTIYGMRCTEERGSHYSWPTANAGKAPELKSSELGEIKVLYPERFGSPESWKTTCQISFFVRHPEFVQLEKDIDLTGWPDKVVLERGASIKVSAKTVDGKQIDDIYPLTQSYPMWVFGKGLTSTGTLKEGPQSLLVVAPNYDKVPLFSKVVKVECDKEKEVVLSDLIVMPGTRLFGTLPADVPRPIEDGSIHVQVVLDAPEERANALEWNDTCKIANDGTFEIPSLPGPGQVQVIAICRGWVSKRSEKTFFVKGQTFDLVENAKELRVELEMEQTGDIDVEVMDSDGNSIVGARVSTWPNQQFLSGGSTILASDFASLAGIQNVISGKPLWERQEISVGRFHQITNEEGRVVLRDIPTDVAQSLHVDHPDFFLSSTTGADKDGVFQYMVVPGETLERLLIMEKREKKK